MGEANKILSVSYGTFSCRLEGFEDSVETMKTVVSYFHELAGHDRFMDLDPQAPDLDELADLTAEEDGAPVEAIADAGTVSLRIKHPETTDAEEPARPSLRLRRDPPAPTFSEDVSGDMSEDDISDLDDMSDLDDVSDLDELDHEEDDVVAADDTIPEDAPEAVVDIDDESTTTLDQLDIEEDDTAAVAQADDDFDMADADDDMIAAEDDTGDMISAEETDGVVAEEETTAEDLTVEAAEDEDETADAPFYDPAAAQTGTDQDDSVAAKLERIRSLVGRVPPANRTASPDVATPAAGNSVADRLSALTGKAPAQEEQTEDLVDDFDFKADNADPLVLSEDNASDDNDNDTQEDDGVNEAEADNTAQDDPSEEDELAIRRANRSKRDNLPEHDDDAMSRIMSQADERLNEPEGRRHRDAFAQLKAAVAATEAARQLGDQRDDADPRDAFREDLDEAVRSDDVDETEDVAPTSRTVSTPLKLVAAQRIEDQDAAPADRLRQIAAVKEGGEDQAGGFAEFASEKGATELADLLEAAAAYIAFVEGDDDFSRPQVMKKVQMASADEFSREDGLRSFGRLLRQSRIIKLNNGRFQVSEDTRFRPDDKAAQG